MSISTYSELLTAVQNWTHRADLASIIPDFITLAESRIYNGTTDQTGRLIVPPLRVLDMQNQSTGTISNQSISLPSGYLGTIRLTVNSGNDTHDLDYLAPTSITSPENSGGNPYYYTIINNAIKTAPNIALAYTHDYYKRFDALTASAPTNWLLTNHPEIYLYGVLIEAAAYTNNDARVPGWMSAFTGAIGGANNNLRTRSHAASLRVVAG